MGRHWVSRMSASALHCLGLDELITDDLAAYEDMAVALAQDAQRLAAIRHRLQRQRSTAPLFDTARFTRHVEQAYRCMWQRYAAGLPPESFGPELFGPELSGPELSGIDP
jgi:predicted O-linked N-acetylglucosamine transferase (SPINDLY family)